MQDVHSAPSQTEYGLVVPLALRALAVVVAARGLMPQAGERRQEQGVLEPMVAKAAGPVGVDRRARFPGRRPQSGIRRQVSRRAEAADRAQLHGNARPEARTDAWQATQDRWLGQGEKNPPDRC